MSDELSTRPSAQPRKRARWGLRAVGIIVVGVAAWFLLGTALGIVRTLIAVAGYLLVGSLAYWIGKCGGAPQRAAALSRPVAPAPFALRR